MSAAIITVADDTTAMFTTLIMRDLNPDIDIFVRAFDEVHVPQLHRAGATAAQSLDTTSGRVIAATVMKESTLFGLAVPIRRRQVRYGPLTGKTVNEIELEFGVNVLLLLRDGTPILYEMAKDVILESSDELILSGIGNEIGDSTSRRTSL